MFIVRDGTQADEACVYATWLHSYRHNSTFAKRIPEGVYFSHHHAVIEALLKRSTVRIATIEDDPSVILGWACFEPGSSELGDLAIEIPAIIHYVYVKPSFRKAGVAAKLLDGVSLAGAMYTHDTYHLQGVIQQKMRRMVFNPYAAMSAK